MSDFFDYPKENSNDIWSAIRNLKNSLNSKPFMKKDRKARASTPNIKSEGCLNINSLSFTCETDQNEFNTQPGP